LSKLLEDGIFEVRTVEGNDIVRILYFFDEGKIIIATNGFVKKQQKTPKSEIELAKKRRKDYFCRRRLEHMSDLEELTNELMQDPEFKKEYESLQPEMDITRAILNARIQAGLTQIQLSEKSGISQADISRLERGTRNPSLSLLKRLAEAMDATLRIEFVPRKHMG